MTVPDDVRQVLEAWARRGRFVTLAEGHRIFSVQEGAGPDLVLVHGFLEQPRLRGRVAVPDRPLSGHDVRPAGLWVLRQARRRRVLLAARSGPARRGDRARPRRRAGA